MYINQKVPPGILLDRKDLLPGLSQGNERPALLLQCQEYLFLLLAADQEFLQRLLIQLPFTHIVVKGLDPSVFVF